ncbi:MAG: sorting protein [Bryobacterales bacterium]|nr:sorting protein [Bryobacterales bacterium]
MQLQRLARLAISVVAFGGISSAITTHVSQSLTGISSPATTITFDGVNNAALFGTNAVITTEFAGVMFSPNLYYDGNSGGGNCAFPNENANCVTNFTSNAGVGTAFNIIPTFSIFFSVPQTAAAFAMITNGDTDVFTAFNNGVQVDTFTIATAFPSGSNGAYYGFQNLTFDQIQVTTTGSNLAVIDNIQLSATATPEPGTIALFGLGMSGLVVLVRRRRANVLSFLTL